MMKSCLTMFLAACAFGLAGCASTGDADAFENAGVKEAQRMIADRRAECVLVKKGVLQARHGRGVMPLLDFYDQTPGKFADTVVVDKVIGRAAAMIALRGGARAVYGEVMSEDALELLGKHGVPAAYGQLVPRILNAKRDGLCPLEQSVAGIEDPAKALTALRRRIAQLRASAPRRGGR